MTEIIRQGTPVFEIKQFKDGRLTPYERHHLPAGLSMQILYRKYHSVYQRSKKRETGVPSRNQFYRAYIQAVKRMAKLNKTTVEDVVNNYHIHTTNLRSYFRFQLIPAEQHRELHKNAPIVCPQCLEAKHKSSFPTYGKGYCKKCWNERERQYAQLRRDRAKEAA